MKKLRLVKSIIALCIIVIAAVVIPIAIAQTTGPKTIATPTKMEYYIVPHQDDEFQMWSQIENDAASYKVFVVMSRGEQTAYCHPGNYAVSYQKGLEFPAGVTPTGQYTPSCETSRNDSMIRYFTDMSAIDPTVPGRLVNRGKTGQFPTNGVDICRRDSAPALNGPCSIRDTSAEVWIDSLNRGAVIVFNVGEGDQTREEVDWVIDTVLANRATIGINTTLPNDLMLGGYFNNVPGNGCAFYENTDHLAVHRALRYNRYPVREQGAAGCNKNPDMTIKPRSITFPNGTGDVEPTNVNAAFELSETPADITKKARIGAHVANYGWLHESIYNVSRTDQSSIFMAPQSFWTIK